MNFITELSSLHLSIANFVATQAHAHNTSLWNQEGYRNPEAMMAHLYNGICCELAFSKIFNVHWRPPSLGCADSGVDFAPDIAVRGTEYLTGSLRITQRDKPENRYVLMIKDGARIKAVGWIYGYNGKQEKNWTQKASGRSPAFWLSQSELMSMDHFDLGFKELM